MKRPGDVGDDVEGEVMSVVASSLGRLGRPLPGLRDVSE